MSPASRVLPVRVALALAMITGCFDAALSGEPRSSAGTSDGQEEDAGPESDDDAGSSSLARHASCADALRPDSRESLDTRNFQLYTKKQNAWTEIDCGAVPSIPRCTADRPCPFFGSCVFLEPGAEGYCIDFQADGAVPTTYGSRQCVMNVPPAAHAALCCNALADVDCSPWPPAAPQGPGALCTSHAHCERGLLCAPSPDLVYGRCACPEAAQFLIANAPWCARESVPSEWGRPAVALPLGGCAEGIAEGVVQEVVATFTPTWRRTKDLALVQDADGYLYATYAEPDALHILTDRALDWPALEKQPSTSELTHWTLAWPVLDPASRSDDIPGYALDVADDGIPHLAYTSGDTVYLLRAVNGAWERTTLAVESEEVMLHVGADGRRVLVLSGFEGTSSALETDAGWKVSLLASGAYVGVVGWPEGQARIVVRDGSAVGIGGLVDPVSGLITKLDTNMLSPVVVGSDLAVLGTLVDPDSVLLMERITADGTATRETLWSRANPYLDPEVDDVSLAFDATGAPFAVHSVPEGLALTQRGPTDDWQTTLWVADRGTPSAVFDRAGALQIFLVVDGDWDGYTEQVRRVRQGACD